MIYGIDIEKKNYLFFGWGYEKENKDYGVYY